MLACLTAYTLASNEDGLTNIGPFNDEDSRDAFEANLGVAVDSLEEAKCGEGDDSGLGFFGEDLDSPAVDPVCSFFSDEEDPGLEDAILWEEDDCRLTSPFLGDEDPLWVSTSRQDSSQSLASPVSSPVLGTISELRLF